MRKSSGSEPKVVGSKPAKPKVKGKKKAPATAPKPKKSKGQSKGQSGVDGPCQGPPPAAPPASSSGPVEIEDLPDDMPDLEEEQPQYLEHIDVEEQEEAPARSSRLSKRKAIQSINRMVVAESAPEERPPAQPIKRTMTEQLAGKFKHLFCL